MTVHPFLAFSVAAAVVFGTLRVSRLRPSALATAVLFALGLGYPALIHLRGRRFPPLDLLFVVTEPWKSAREAMAIGWTSAGITGDLWQLFVPWAAAVRAAWHAGVWPLWTPHALSGTVLLGAGQAAPFAPDQLLMLACSFENGFTAAAALVLLIAAVSAYLYAREIGVSESAALVAAGCWAFSSYHFFWLGWRHGAAGGLFPLVLLGIRRVARAPNRGSLLLLAAAFALVAISGHPETLLHLSVAGGLAFLWELGAARAGPSPGRWRRPVATALGAGLLALALSAVALAPIVDVLPQSFEWQARHNWAGADRPLRSVRSSAEDVAGTLVPFVNGVWEKESPKRTLPQEPFSTGYIGSIGLAFALIGLIASPHRVKWMLLFLGAFGLAASSGFAPVELLIRSTPLLAVAVNTRLVLVTGVALSILAALGFEVLFGGGENGERKIAHRALPMDRLAVAMARLAPVVAVGLLALLWTPLRRSGLSEPFLFGQSRLYVVPLLVHLPLCAMRRYPRAAMIVALAAIVGQRVGEAGHFHAGAKREAFDLLVAPLDSLPRPEPRPYRIVGIGEFLQPNTSALVGLDDIRGYEAVHFARYVDTLPLWATSSELVPYTRVESLTSPFLDFLGVRWALDRPGEPIPDGWQASGKETPTWRLLENREALPLAFVPREIRAVTDPRTTVEALGRESSLRDVAFIERRAGGSIAASEANAQGEVEIESTAPGRYRLQSRLDREGWIVTSIPAWRGWRASTATARLETAFGDHAFIAIRAPAGSSEIELDFVPRAFEIGLWTSAVALVAWLVLLLFWLRGRARANDVVLA